MHFNSKNARLFYRSKQGEMAMKQNILMTSAFAVLLTTSTSVFAMKDDEDPAKKGVALQQPATVIFVDQTQPRFSPWNFVWFLWGSEAPSGNTINQGFTVSFPSRDVVHLSSPDTARLWFVTQALSGHAPTDIKGAAIVSPWTLAPGDTLTLEFNAEEVDGKFEAAFVQANPIKELAKVHVKVGLNVLTYTAPASGIEVKGTPDIVAKGKASMKLSRFALKITKPEVAVK